MQIHYTRCAKAIGCKFDKTFIDVHQKTIAKINRVMAFIIGKIKSGEFIDIKNNRNFILADGSVLSQAKFNELYWGELFSEINPKSKKGQTRDQVTAYAVERIVSNANRNKKSIDKVKLPRIHNNKSLYVKSACVEIDTDNNQLIFSSFLQQEKIKIPYNNNISLNMGYLKNYRITKTNQATTGGNFHLKQRAFIAQIEKSVNALYDPVDFLGFDINIESGKWLVFNKNCVLNKFADKPEDIHDLIVQIKTINEKISDVRKPVKERKYRTKERRKQRLHWKQLHKELNKLCKKVAQEIIDYCIQNKYCLCIDNLSSGEKNGTFGQDHLVELLKTMCEDQRIPFYSIPTPYTSRTCSNCDYCHKDNRDKNNFKCLSCGHEEDSHLNAAKNIANFGKYYYDNDLPYGRNICPKTWNYKSVVRNYKKKLINQQQTSRSFVNC